MIQSIFVAIYWNAAPWTTRWKLAVYYYLKFLLIYNIFTFIACDPITVSKREIEVVRFAYWFFFFKFRKYLWTIFHVSDFFFLIYWLIYWLMFSDIRLHFGIFFSPKKISTLKNMWERKEKSLFHMEIWFFSFFFLSKHILEIFTKRFASEPFHWFS